MGAKQYFSIKGEHPISKIKELVEERNIRRMTISDKAGGKLHSFRLVVGAVFAPVLAAVGALAELIDECTIAVEREEEAG